MEWYILTEISETGEKKTFYEQLLAVPARLPKGDIVDGYGKPHNK